jgi:hypothetical protein
MAAFSIFSRSSLLPSSIVLVIVLVLDFLTAAGPQALLNQGNTVNEGFPRFAVFPHRTGIEHD